MTSKFELKKIIEIKMADRVIDTHIHVWNFEQARYDWLKNDTSILHRNYDIADLEHDRVAAGITGGVLVQAANNFEDVRTKYLQVLK